ncbi:tape measure protein [Lampropedia cohaerens]|nr:tape measure protein [Lampropedia cohaerens]
MSEQVGAIYYTVEADTEKLLSGSKKVDASLDDLNKTLGKTDKASSKASMRMRETAKAAREVAIGADQASKAWSTFSKVVAAYLSMRTLSYLAELADVYGQNADRIRNATKNTEDYEKVQARLLQTANGTYRSLAEAQEVFLSTSRVLQDLGYSLDEVLDISDSLSYAFVRDAARADQATSAMDAYSKALAKGKIDADAWASIIAASDSIIQSVANATGRTTLEIQRLGAEGKLSIEALNEGLRQSLAENKAAADAMSVSTRDATVQMRNALTVFAGKVNEASGASNIFTETVGEMARTLQDPATINAAVDMANGIVTALNTIIKGMRNTVRIAKWFGEELAARLHGAAIGDIVRLEEEERVLRKRLNSWYSFALDREELQRRLDKNLSNQRATREIAAAYAPRSSAAPSTVPSNPTAPRIVSAEAPGKPRNPKNSPANKELRETIRLQEQLAKAGASYLLNLQERVGEVDKLSHSERLYYDIAAGTMTLTAKELEQARELARVLDEREKSRKAEADVLNILNAELSAQRQLMSEIAGYDADIAGMSMGDQARADMEARLQLQQQFAQRMQQIEDQRRQALAQADESEHERIRKMYDDVLKIEQDYQGKSLAAYDEYIQRKREADTDWSTGAKRAWENYVEQSQNAASQADNAMSNWLQGTEDALVNFVQTGKLSFRDLANSIIADLARIAAKQMITGLIGNIFGSFAGGWQAAGVQTSGAVTTGIAGGSITTTNLPPAPGRANGGPVGANKLYRVNERGQPEVLNVSGRQYLLMGNQSGNVTAMGRGSSGGGGGWSGASDVRVVIENMGQPLQATSARLETDGMGQVLRVVVEQATQRAVAAVTNSIASGQGGPHQALNSRYAMQPRR